MKRLLGIMAGEQLKYILDANVFIEAYGITTLSISAQDSGRASRTTESKASLAASIESGMNSRRKMIWVNGDQISLLLFSIQRIPTT